MAILTKAQLQADNSASFADNNTQAITPLILRSYNGNIIDTLVDSLDTGSFARTAVSNDFTQANSFTSISASSFISASAFTGDGSRLTNITASVALPISEEGVLLGYATQLNFSGSNISASLQAGIATISVNTNNLVTTSSFNTFTASVNTFTASQVTKDTTLQTYTASVDTKFTAVGSSTASLNSFTSSQTTKDSTLATYTGSVNTSLSALNQFTASQSTASIVTSLTELNSFTSSQNTKNSTLAIYTASIDTKFTAVGSSTASLNAFTASFTFNTASFVSTASFQTYTSSIDTKFVAVGSSTSSLNTFTASAQTSITNLNSFSSSVLTQLNTLANVTSSLISKTGSYATTGSNTFIGDQTITGNITAFSASFTYLQTIFESSSVIYSSGSNQFGDELSDTQTLSGSVKVQGSLTINGTPVQTSSVDISALNSFTSSQLTINTAIQASTSSLNTFSASTLTRLTNIESTTASLNSSVAALNTFTASQSTASLVTSITNLNTFSASALVSISNLNSFTSSQETKDTTLASVTSSLNTATASLFTSTSLSLTTASFSGNTLTFTKGDGTTFGVVIPDVSGSGGTFATLGANTFTGSQTISSSLNVSGSANFVGGDVNFTDQGRNINIDVDRTIIKGQKPTLISQSLDIQNTLTASLAQGFTYVGDANGRTTTVATSSFATNVSNLATTGSNSFNGNQTITGSLILSSSAAVELQVIGNSVFTGSAFGNVVALSITSNTASMDLNLGNYFTLTLAGTATTHISASNVQPGVSATLVITTGTNSSASLAPTMLQPSGSSYSATNGSGKKDVLSIVAVASGVPFVVSTKNMI
jgi:hypothetical protein